MGTLLKTALLETESIMLTAKAEILYGNTDQTTIITLPADAVIWNISIEVVTGFDSDGTDLLDVGNTGTADVYASNENIASATDGMVEQFTMKDGVRVGYKMSASTAITFQYAYSGSAPTAGQAFVYIHYTLQE